MVDVPSREEFDALAARVAVLESQIKVMPVDVKTALTVVLGWIEANV